ncbi:MAG: HD domain-containing phosphohydrolase [Mariprofundaceae bacterium]
MKQSNLHNRIRRLNEIGVALSAEENTQHLLEFILMGARELTRADGGTLYILDENKELNFMAVQTDSLDIKMGELSNHSIPMQAIPLYKGGEPNHHNVAAHVALTEKTVNISDAYHEVGFNFSGTKAFDKKTGYRSKSFLTVPLRNQKKVVIGVLQLINALDEHDEITIFDTQDQQIAESLASQAAVAITNQRLVSELRDLMESFIAVISKAIDEKSTYTGGHCRRVPELALMLTDAACQTDSGELRNFQMTSAERYEMKISGMMHDCGKITTPVHIVDKSTKLEAIMDRIELIDTRLEVLQRDAEIAALKRLLNQSDLEKRAHHDSQFHTRSGELASIRNTLHRCNIGSENMKEEEMEKVYTIAQEVWHDHEGNQHALLNADEIENLTVQRGTLTDEQRQIINHHIVSTITMLDALPFPKHLQAVPEIAGGHHEHIDGSGYPKGLTGEEMSVQAKALAIADIFEALTAQDRPYKKPMPLSTSLKILRKMKDNDHIDSALFDVFIQKKVYLTYGKRFLTPSQLDVD